MRNGMQRFNAIAQGYFLEANKAISSKQMCVHASPQAERPMRPAYQLNYPAFIL
jgi:hypothetical protein